MMQQEPQLSNEQKRSIAEIAERTGLTWQEVLMKALDFTRFKKERKSAETIIGLFADDPDAVDAALAQCYHMREHADLRTDSHA